MRPEEEIVLWVGAASYYIGRTTHSVSDFCSLLIAAWPGLNPATKGLIRARVEEVFEECGCTDAFCDARQWEDVRKLWSV